MKKKFLAFYRWLFNKHPHKKVKLNCPCYDIEGNFLGWYSRSVAVTLFSFAYDENGTLCVLASQRGKGTPDPEFVGAWNGVSGYCEWGETFHETACRETLEETGVKISPDQDFTMLYIKDDPKSDKRENISFVYYTILPESTKYYETMFSHDHNEKDEVGAISFIEVNKVPKLRWAFGHDKIIQMCLDKINY